ncbi:Holliday junction branch migration protein RuvA [Patescibacteria group bacterium]
MIASLSGKPKPHTPTSIIVDVEGVGYKVFTPPTLLNSLLKKDAIDLFIYTHVRDDTFALYGFDSLDKLQLFELIISISGIGPKIAIILLDKGAEAITTAVSKADVDFFTSVPRLGKKNAQKIIIELKPKLGDLEDLDLASESSETQEAVSALVGLGFTKKQSQRALKQIADPNDSIEDKITKAIKYLGKNK